MSTRSGTGQIICIHDALSSTDLGGIYGPRQVSGKYEFSYEFAEFLARYERGSWTANETDLRCYDISTRKGCYQDLLIDSGFDNLTDTGNDAAMDAKIITAKIIQYYHRKGISPYDYTKATKMDEIVPYGFPQSQSIFLLAALISYLPVDEHPQYMKEVATRIKAWNMKTSIVEDKEYLLVGSIRNNTISRNAGNQLLKLGLACVINLPKTKESRGRGRAPVGMYVSEMGIRFYADYLQQFSQNARYQRRLFGTGDNPISSDKGYEDTKSTSFMEYGQEVLHRPAMGPPETITEELPISPEQVKSVKPVKSDTSHIPDVIDGEDLRELFG